MMMLAVKLPFSEVSKVARKPLDEPSGMEMEEFPFRSILPWVLQVPVSASVPTLVILKSL